MKERIELNAEALRMRRKMGVDASSPIDVFSLVEHSEHLTLVFVPMGQRFSGMCVKAGSQGLIAVNSRMSYGRQRLAVAHELYHLHHADPCGRRVCLLDLDEGDDLEQEANTFASFLLAPYDALHDFITHRLQKGQEPLTVDDVVRIEQYFGFSRRGMLRRLTEEGLITAPPEEVLHVDMVEQAARLGFDSRLYSPAESNRTYYTLGYYIRMAEDLRYRDLITPGKYEELMLAAFRADRVFGTEGDGPPDD